MPDRNYAAIDDGKIVLYEDRRNALGVSRITRTPTDLIASAFPTIKFPALTKYTFSGYQLWDRERWRGIPKDRVLHAQAFTQTRVHDDNELMDGEADRRWQLRLQRVRDMGGLCEVWAHKALPKGGKKAFKTWAGAIWSGAFENAAYDALVAAHGLELANDFCRVTKTPSGVWGTKPELIILTRATAKGYEPAAWFGKLPEIDWTNERD